MTKIRQPQVWCWWDRDEPEDGMTGFFTAEDRNRFFAGGPGPFRRVLAPDGHTTSQIAEWNDILRDNDRYTT